MPYSQSKNSSTNLFRNIEAIHQAVDQAVEPLAREHAARLHCALGCTRCCVDELTVFEVEAEPIRTHYAHLLSQGEPGPIGACAFLGSRGECRIYRHRPYVCRTQGLPLRWEDEAEDEQGELFLAEFRDICPLNEDGEPIEELEPEACWTLGPTESDLAILQAERGEPLARVALRSLFLRESRNE